MRCGLSHARSRRRLTAGFDPLSDKRPDESGRGRPRACATSPLGSEVENAESAGGAFALVNQNEIRFEGRGRASIADLSPSSSA